MSPPAAPAPSVAAARGPGRAAVPAERPASAAGLRRLALALAAGLLLYAGHPPIDLGAAGWVALAPLLVLARDLVHEGRHGGVRRAFGWGVVAGVTFFVPLLVWLSPFGGVVPWLVLALIQALSVGAYLAGLVAWGSRPGRPAVAVVWWVALEAIRAAVPLGGFGWGILGYSQHGGGPLLPLARTLGVLGVSAACALLAVCVEELAHRGVPGRRSLTPALGALAVPLACLALAGAPPAPSGETVDIASVQGAELRSTNAAGINRADTGRVVRIAEQMLLATRPLADDPPEITVWPENSLDADIRDPAAADVLAQVSEARALLGGRTLLANTFEAGPRPRTYYNALVEITGEGFGQVYRKQRPVPIGEYVPLRGLLERYPAAEQLPTYDVLPGPAVEPMTLAGVRLATVVCYENLFPGVVRDQVRRGADLVLVSTNNTSYGGAMSEQHLALSQLRAVETGRHILHAGISGISGLIDPRGEVTQRTVRFEEALVRANVPLVQGQTLATRLGDAPGLLAVALSAAGLVVLLGTRRRPAA